MTDFDYEVKEKKALARSAKYKVNGSRSKKCTLATDHMTPSQIKKMNGETVAYNFNKPMDWDTFKKVHPDLGKEYILNLVDLYGVNFKSLSEMFGVSRDRVFKFLSVPPYNFKFGPGSKMSAQKRAAWEAFLGGEKKSEASPVETAPEEKTEAIGIPETAAATTMTMDDFTFRFSGKITADAVANALRVVLGDGLNGTIVIKGLFGGCDNGE